jgi:hypothetical protein
MSKQTIEFDPTMLEAAAAVAEDFGVSREDVINMALADWLIRMSTFPPLPDNDADMDRMLDAASHAPHCPHCRAPLTEVQHAPAG